MLSESTVPCHTDISCDIGIGVLRLGYLSEFVLWSTAALLFVCSGRSELKRFRKHEIKTGYSADGQSRKRFQIKTCSRSETFFCRSTVKLIDQVVVCTVGI